MKITAVLERTLPISRYADPAIPPGGLDTSAVAVVTDLVRGGEPVVGYGFASIGRFAQGGLIHDRFAPRLLAAADLSDPDTGSLDPDRAWAAMMAGEKPGGHGERSVAVGTLDMALWDAAAKAAGLPLWRYIARRLGRDETRAADPVPVYAGGGYYYPSDDRGRLRDEMAQFRDAGYTRAKIKVGAAGLAEDLARIEIAAQALGGAGNLAVDAVYSYGPEAALAAAEAFQPYGLWWFEDICDPLDFTLLAHVAAAYGPPIAAGEGNFGAADARNLLRHGGLRADLDVLLFDIAHCYGLPEYIRMIELAEDMGWDRRSFWPHGGHLFTLHAVAALGLGGAEVNPHNFQPFGGLSDTAAVADGHARPPDLPGIGFEGRAALADLFGDLLRRGA
ncbi:MAG: enolase C-terminal domain-like protein [Rhodospirillales bacterium]